MSTGKIEVICGACDAGKTALAFGKAIEAITTQKQVIMIQFLKGKHIPEHLDMLERLEPELKVFRFEKAESYFENLTDSEQDEERINIQNGLNYAKKVLATGECDLLILDEALGVVDQGIIGEDELISLLDARNEVDVILTGRSMPEKIEKIATRIMRVEVK